MIAFGSSDQGKMRENNEDAFFVSVEKVGMFDSLFIVADGMGGHRFGEVASGIAVRAAIRYILESPVDNPIHLIEQAVSVANLEVRKQAEALRGFGMGTTMVIAAVVGRQVYIANVGDSRLYALSMEEFSMTQITKDHSYAEELAEKGLIVRGSPGYRRQKNKITRALGAMAEVEADLYELELENNMYLLLCTDGLTSMVTDVVIKNLALDTSFSIEGRVETLIREANKNGGKDNITVILCCNTEDEK